MWRRLLSALGLLALGIGIWWLFSSEGFTQARAGHPGYAPPIEALPERGDLEVASSGPNPPNVAPPRALRGTISPDPEPKDPYEETVDTADAPERLRHPERSFSPGVVPDNTGIAVQGGVASVQVANSAQAFQQFAPEGASNGGQWLDNVSAMEMDSPNYSAF